VVRTLIHFQSDRIRALGVIARSCGGESKAIGHQVAMSAAKSSRSRQSGASGVFPVNGGATQESGVQLADKLKIFKTENFDPDAYVQSKCQTMNEKVPI
jgi:hypothetical protein